MTNLIIEKGELPILKELKEIQSSFSEETTAKLTDFFLTQDAKLLRGIPRWILVDSVVEIYGITPTEMFVKSFYRVTEENPVGYI